MALPDYVIFITEFNPSAISYLYLWDQYAANVLYHLLDNSQSRNKHDIVLFVFYNTNLDTWCRESVDFPSSSCNT